MSPINSEAAYEGYNTLGGFASDIVNSITNVVNNAFNNLRSFVNSVGNRIEDRIENGMSTIGNVVGNVVNRVGSWISGAIDEVRTVRTDLGNYVASVIREARDSVSRVSNELGSRIREAIQGFREGIGSVVSAIGQWLYDRLKDLYNYLWGLSERFWQWVARVVEENRERIQDAIHRAQEWVTSTARRLYDGFKELVVQVTEKIQPILEKIEKEYITPIKGFLDGLFNSADNYIAGLEGTLFAPLLGNPQIAPLVSQLLPKDKRLRAVVGFLMAGVIGVMLTPQLLSDVYFGMLEKVRQGSLAHYRSGLINLDDAIQAYYAGTLDLGSVYEVAIRQGISDQHINALVGAFRRYPSPSDLIFLVRIGVIDYGVYADIMRKQGYRDEDSKLIFDATEYVPTIPDLIRMAVREVFSPEVAEKFGQYEDFPEDFAKYARMLGMKEEWAKAYWAAHWDLPSVSQGFEMLHRGIITREELELLLRSLDVMPFWRDKLIKLSYEPYTRVDVRRMYELGVLSREEVKRAYLDLGYDEDKAEKLTIWTEREYSQAAKEKTEKTRDLSQSTILSAYDKGIINKGETLEYLMGLGYDEAEANLLIDMTDLNRYTKERDKLIENLKKQYLAGSIDDIQIREALAKFGLTHYAIDQYIDEITASVEVGTKIPSVADLQKFLKKGLITLDEFIEGVMKNGYSRKWAQAYAKVA